MRDRRKLEVMGKLASVQRVRKAAAEAALMTARAAEAQARAEEKETKSRTEAAEREWGDHVSGAGFSPEFGGALAARIVERDAAASQAAKSAERASEITARRQGDWQLSDARSRSGEESLRKLRRRVNARIEEDRLAAMADRVTFDWSRR
jgi:hypothetical protein